MAWRLEFDPDALKDLKTLDQPVQTGIVQFLRMRIADSDDPRAIYAVPHWAATGSTALATGALFAAFRMRASSCGCCEWGIGTRYTEKAHAGHGG